MGQLKDTVNVHRQQFMWAVHERDHKHDKMMQLTREKEVLQALIVQLTQE